MQGENSGIMNAMNVYAPKALHSLQVAMGGMPTGAEFDHNAYRATWEGLKDMSKTEIRNSLENKWDSSSLPPALASAPRTVVPVLAVAVYALVLIMPAGNPGKIFAGVSMNGVVWAGETEAGQSKLDAGIYDIFGSDINNLTGPEVLFMGALSAAAQSNKPIDEDRIRKLQEHYSKLPEKSPLRSSTFVLACYQGFLDEAKTLDLNSFSEKVVIDDPEETEITSENWDRVVFQGVLIANVIDLDARELLSYINDNHGDFDKQKHGATLFSLIDKAKIARERTKGFIARARGALADRRAEEARQKTDQVNAETMELLKSN